MVPRRTVRPGLVMVAVRFTLCLLLAGLTAGSVDAQESGTKRLAERGGREGGGEKTGAGGQTGGAGGEGDEFPAPFGTVFDFLDPGRYHRRLDQLRGLETDRSDKPRGPELPLAVFVESIRPLGSLKYENQLNYLVSTFTGDAPTFQTITYEYVFADWNAARVELVAPRPGSIDALGLGYQRTLRVGENHNWASGFLILPELSLKGTGFVGGSAFYTRAWKPEEKSPWTVAGSLGANRASFSNRPLGGAVGGTGSAMERLPGMDTTARAEESDEARVWRPFISGNLWYTFSPKLTVGLEAVAYPHDRFGEYLVQPNLTWRPTKHFFVQVGAGYYEVGGHGQAVFSCRMNLLNPTPRRTRDAGE